MDKLSSPLFSIITPVLNNKTGLLKTIESIKNQSLESYEHIVVDGGSTDGTLEIIIKENCIIGGQAGIADHTEISSNTTILSRSGVTKSIKTPGVYAGFPAKISTNFWREQVILRQLAKINKKSRFK